MVNNEYLISQDESIITALTRINNLRKGPLVLFVVNGANQMVGTLTDGDVRRSLIAGAKLEDPISTVMHRHFNFIVDGGTNLVEAIHRQRELKMKLVPILDNSCHIVDVIDLTHLITKLPVDAVLMAGGKGERLRPLTEKTPKPLLKVGDKSIIDHNIDRLISYGIEHISVTVNYLKEQLEEHFSVPRNNIQVNCVREPRFLGTIGSIQYIKKFYNDTVLVMNSDVFTNINFEDFYLHYKEHNAVMSVAALPYTVSVPYGIFSLDGRVIKGIVEKPTYNYYANAGIYLIDRKALDEIPKDTFFHSTDLIEKLISEGKKVIRFPLNGTWIDIGNPQEYQKANELVKHIK